ncbi:hypothetical protein CKF43_03355 [Pantoea graminicola]|nr:hypothetical protein CKF43_03355 [Pantoea sp. ARC607]
MFACELIEMPASWRDNKILLTVRGVEFVNKRKQGRIIAEVSTNPGGSSGEKFKKRRKQISCAVYFAQP